MPTALVVDDSPLVRAQLKVILARIGCTVVAELSSGDDVAALYDQLRPDLVTLDIVMPGKDGVTAAVELLREHPDARVVMCTSLAARDKILACRRAGVRHYLLKPFDPARAAGVFRYALGYAAAPALGAPLGGEP